MVPKANKKVSTAGSEGGLSVKGEKSKEKTIDGATGDGDDEESSSEDQGGAGARQCLTKEKLDHLCRHLGDGRGECVIVVLIVSVCCCCCAGINCCKLCKGRCCSLVNDVINILIEYREIDPDAEVNIVCYWLIVLLLLCCFRVIGRLLLTSVLNWRI